MTENEIKEFYDSNPNLTLSELSRITGKTVKKIKKILLTPSERPSKIISVRQ